MGNTLCGSVAVIAIARAIANAHTPRPDDAHNSLHISLRFLLWYKLRAAVDANVVLRYYEELDAPCRLRRFTYS